MVRLDLSYRLPSRVGEIIVALMVRARDGLYLVGGFLRDLLLGRESYDLDLLYMGNPLELLGDLDVTWFPLDRARGIYRAIWGEYQVDIAAPRDPTLEGDLLERDFTVNAMACSLKTGILVDPWGGLGDLEARVLRAVTPWAMDEDPLRVLRAFRLSLQLAFSPTRDTLELAQRAAGGLGRVARERIKDELSLILGHPASGRALVEMGRWGVLEVLFPEVEEGKGLLQGKWLGGDLKEHLLGTLLALERILPFVDFFFPMHASSLKGMLAREVEGGMTVVKVLKLAALLHDIGKPSTLVPRGDDLTFWGHDREGGEQARRVGERLGLGNKGVDLLTTLVSNHMWLHLLARQKEVTPRARGRFFRRLGEGGCAVILLSLADALASSGEVGFYLLLSLAEEMVDFYYSRFLEDARLQRPLLNGHQVMELLSLSPGPRVGEVLRALLEAQSGGLVTTEEEAREFVKRYMQ